MQTFVTISVTLFLLSGEVAIGQGMSPPSGTKKDSFRFNFESRSYFNSGGNKFSFFPQGQSSSGFNAPNRYWFSSSAFLFSRQNNLYSGRSPRFDYFNRGPLQAPYLPFYGPPLLQLSPQVDGSQVFVEQWVNRKPSSDSVGQSLSSSPLLREGMSEEEVMGRLGSPLERNRIEEREVWKYSGYSLVFVEGRLKEWR
jgi:hypothetical protein